jgi:hypothetical protein
MEQDPSTGSSYHSQLEPITGNISILASDNTNLAPDLKIEMGVRFH